MRPCAEKEYVCNSVCGRPYACGNHKCEKVCHSGDCGECALAGDRQCYCGKKTFKKYSCDDGKSVVQGKRVSVRVDLGGRSIIKKTRNALTRVSANKIKKK